MSLLISYLLISLLSIKYKLMFVVLNIVLIIFNIYLYIQ
jgi:hypothetical protein